LRAYRDPSTGAFVEPPPGAVVATPNVPRVPAALSEEAAPGGGRMIRLRGAFHSANTNIARDSYNTDLTKWVTSTTPTLQ
jgi:hypothetical protein